MMVGLQLQRSRVVHLGQHTSGGGWRSWCWRLHAAQAPDVGLATKPDWRGRGGGKPVEWLPLADVPDGHTVCLVCLRRWRADSADLLATLQRLGQ